jgi:hypothetical protein
MYFDLILLRILSQYMIRKNMLGDYLISEYPAHNAEAEVQMQLPRASICWEDTGD